MIDVPPIVPTASFEPQQQLMPAPPRTSQFFNQFSASPLLSNVNNMREIQQFSDYSNLNGYNNNINSDDYNIIGHNNNDCFDSYISWVVQKVNSCVEKATTRKLLRLVFELHFGLIIYLIYKIISFFLFFQQIID